MKTKRKMIALGVGIISAVAWVALYNHVHASSVSIASTQPTTFLAGIFDINADVVDHKDDGSMNVADDEDG